MSRILWNFKNTIFTEHRMTASRNGPGNDHFLQNSWWNVSSSFIHSIQYSAFIDCVMHSVVATLLRIVPEIVIASLNMTGVWWDFTCFSKKKKTYRKGTWNNCFQNLFFSVPVKCWTVSFIVLWQEKMWRSKCQTLL